MALEILANAQDWLTLDAENLSKFLETDTGKRLIPKLVEHCPTLLDKGETNAILIRSGQVLAWNGMIEALLLLAHPAPPPPPANQTEYPALTDDAAWNDGQRLEQAPTDKVTEPLQQDK